eukprot:CAMPEP_0179325564 /NCGR_PEP_ID=MMETSP0797-20121207/60964_1 /TAXON_ID=47934 /ORGANISM="Dinophysis acuminata, Strain DAEP01" /LENGTH=86 /DNA_ID=CAMNT_0021037767 /DNA_START=71 /DNA_END=331 /DNA_ORIENTATION=+
MPQMIMQVTTTYNDKNPYKAGTKDGEEPPQFVEFKLGHVEKDNAPPTADMGANNFFFGGPAPRQAARKPQADAGNVLEAMQKEMSH